MLDVRVLDVLGIAGLGGEPLSLLRLEVGLDLGQRGPDVRRRHITCSKLDLTGRVGGQHLVEAEVVLRRTKLGNHRRQLNGLAVIDP